MIIPSLLPVLSPVILYFIILSIGGQVAALAAVGAMLLGVIITGLFVAVSMTAGGGAWDNAKKNILKMDTMAEKVQKLIKQP
jgi:K(+)-stimulated pyrophosphate-energized sodium pump